MSHRVGSQHHAAKITEDDVRAIRQARREGKTIDAIFTQFAHLRISHSTVERIVYGLNWKHVE